MQKPIIKRNRAYVEAGGTFVIPLPVPMTVDASNLDNFLNA
jgi:hypothetical protein